MYFIERILSQRRERVPNKTPDSRRFFIALAAGLLLIGFAPPSIAGPLEDAVSRIENKVDNANGKLNTIRDGNTDLLSETAGLQSLTSTANGAVSGFRPQVLTDLVATLDDFQDLFEYLQAEASSAGASGDYPDLFALVTALESLLNVLLGDIGTSGDLGGLTDLMQMLPDNVLAVTGRALSKAGVDSQFISDLDTLSVSLATIKAVNLESDDPPGLFVPGGMRCSAIDDSNRQGIRVAAHSVLSIGLALKVGGAGLEAIPSATKIQAEGAVWGWAGVGIHTNIPGALGKFMGGVADGVIATAGTTYLRIRACESLYYQKAVLHEVCTLNRGASDTCQTWLNSSDAAEFLP